MQTLKIEMLPSLCKHCAEYHSNKKQHQKQHQSEISGECPDLAHVQQSMWQPISTVRKRITKFRDLLNDGCGRNQSETTTENAMNVQNDIAYTSNDQFLQHSNNISITNSQSMESSECVSNGASMLLAESSKMNGLNNYNMNISSNGALNGHPQSIRSFNVQTMTSNETVTLRSSSSLSSLTTATCEQCHCTNDNNHGMETEASHQPIGQKCSNFGLNTMPTEMNPIKFSVKNDRVSNNSSELKRGNDKNGINPNGTSRSVRTVSANYSKNLTKKYAYVNHRWPYAISSTINYSHVLLICIAFIVFGVRNALIMADDTPVKSKELTTIAERSGICSSKDIRNSAKNLKELRNCRIIEGFLVISLIDKYNESDYDGMEFPELTEVTDYVLIYRVNGLKSVGKLFPNLRIIRGNNLLHDFSLVVFEMMHLQEIGLKSLLKIIRGSVRIEKNPALCFVDTVDWSLLTSGTRENVFSNNKAVNECPTCPNGMSNDKNMNTGLQSGTNSPPVICPEISEKKRICWNRSECQQICPAKCGNSTCNANSDCCHDSCVGCANNNTSQCLSCRYLSVGSGEDRQCVQKCPDNFYALESRRCVTAEECRATDRPILLMYDNSALHSKPYIPHDGECTYVCPTNYYPDGPSGKRQCLKCDGNCKKECPAGSIDSISAAQRYRGCTHIQGSFQINIKTQGGQNTARELETFLSDIVVIEGNLVIQRSYPLISLGFFRSLRIIRGDTAGKEHYGLKVVDNPNLQALFPNNVTIEHGRMFFHFNPRLCMSSIEEVKKNVVDLRNVNVIPAEDVAPNSNGDKIACNVTTLYVNITKIRSNVAILELTPLPYEDERQLLGYVLHYMPSPFKNVTMFEGRDACGGDAWTVEDILDSNRNSTTISYIITHLKPYTQYAYFVKTYTVASEQRGGLSPIQYFTTLPYKPDPITKLSVVANGSSEIMIKWRPPIHAHGNLTKYIIKCQIVNDSTQLLEQRNYCNEPLGVDDKILPAIPNPNEAKITVKEKDDEKESTDSSCRCAAEDGKSKFSDTDTEVEQLIQFEDALHNVIYVRTDSIHVMDEDEQSDMDSQRKRRDLASHTYPKALSMFNMIKHRSIQKRSANTTQFQSPDVFPEISEDPFKPKSINDDTIPRLDKTKTYYEYFYAAVNSSVFSLTLHNLKHYAYYSISVKACREGDGDNCGNDVIAYQRTGKIEENDDVKDVKVEKLPASNHSTGIRLHWKPPENPNGIIVSYVIRYQRVDIEHAKYQDICIPHNLFHQQDNSHVITDLVNGNYSFTVVANSLAGPNTRWSSPIYYTINETTITASVIALIVILIILLLCGIGALFWFYKRKYGPPDSGLKLIASVNPEYVSMQYQPDEWEIARDRITQLNELGQGSFGMVYEGIVDIDHQQVRCAIKTVNENATDRERINFLKEAGVMKAFDTHHVVRLLGVVSRGQPVLVVMELMINGDLKGYLRSHRPESGNEVQPPTLRQILQMAIEIADGMAYLSAKKFVHRDLAARNCMVAEDLTVKIGDFGMTRDIYETDYYRKGTKGLLPVRWMAPESLKDGVFTSCSDVFSFGIVLWEMATLASQPYQGLSNDQVLRYVIDGGVMERPENCPERIYSLMCKTWQHRPTARPTFMQIVSMLLDEAAPNFRDVSFYHSQAGQELLQLPQHQLNVVDARTPLRAEEENFSVGVDDEDDPEDPNSFLMEKRNISRSQQSASVSVPSNSPLRSENCSTIPDVALSKSIPKKSSHHFKIPLLSHASHQPSKPSFSFFDSLLASNKPANNNSTSAHASRTHCNDSEPPSLSSPLPSETDSTAILIPSANLMGRNGIKPNVNPLNLIKFGNSANNSGEHSNNDYCNTSNSGTGDAKAYKLLNSLS